MSTLYEYYEEAQLTDIPEEFKDIQLWFAMKDEPLKPRWHQVTGLNLCFLAERTGLYDEQGTGKTLISQAFAIWQAKLGNRTVCLMPPVLVGQFFDAFNETFLGIGKLVDIQMYRGTAAQRQALINKWNTGKWPDIVIMSYDAFREEGVVFGDYNCLIMDEAKVMGNADNIVYDKIEQFMGEYGQKYGIVMNGTPAKNNLADLYGYIRFTSPWIYPSELNFQLRHVRFKKINVRVKDDKERGVRIIDKFVDTNEMWLNLYNNARRVEKQEVVELPAKNIIPFPFDLSKKHRAAYLQFCSTKLLIFDDNTILDGTTSSSMRQNAMKSVIHTDLLQLGEESAAFEALKELLDMTGIWTTKVFIMCHYRKTVEKLKAYLKKYNPAVIYGGSGNSEKEKNKFLKDDTCRVAVVNYVAGGVGLNLQGVCYTGIAFEPTTVPGDFDQAVDRLHRSGQTKNVNIYVLMPRGTIFVTAVNAMIKKKAYNSSVVSRRQLLAELEGTDLSDLLKEATESEMVSERVALEESEEGKLSPDPELQLASGWNML